MARDFFYKYGWESAEQQKDRAADQRIGFAAASSDERVYISRRWSGTLES